MGTAAPTTSSGRWLSLQITKYPLGAMEPAERPDPGQPKNDFFFFRWSREGQKYAARRVEGAGLVFIRSMDVGQLNMEV